MNELLADIKTKLQSGDYKNEEHVRLSLVARILQNLGWDIWNPKEVNTEFIVVPNEDKTRVDVALFIKPSNPDVFIEIKGAGQIQGKLSEIERQLRDYNRNLTAMFTIITDGCEWRFYYSQTGGEFSKKCFEDFSFADDNLNDIEESLSTFLRKSEIKNENAKLKAENYLQLNRKQQTAEDCLPEARRKIGEPPYPSLPEALVSLVSEKDFVISQDEAVEFIKQAAERKPATTVSRADSESRKAKGEIAKLDLKEVPSAVEDKYSRRRRGTGAPLTYRGQLICTSKGATAIGHLDATGLLVLKGSQAVFKEWAGAKRYPSRFVRRNELIADRTLEKKDGFYVFQKDVLFTSPSTAASVIQGTSVNGLLAWRSKAGVPLKKLE